MATQQFEACKELILQFTHKNRMNTESDIKGVVPGELDRQLQIPSSSLKAAHHITAQN